MQPPSTKLTPEEAVLFDLMRKSHARDIASSIRTHDDYPDLGTRARADALCERGRFLWEQGNAISARIKPLLREPMGSAPRGPSSADAPSSESRLYGECSTTPHTARIRPGPTLEE
jgi:hypothetical protein